MIFMFIFFEFPRVHSPVPTTPIQYYARPTRIRRKQRPPGTYPLTGRELL
jgi:hypothetical protein